MMKKKENLPVPTPLKLMCDRQNCTRAMRYLHSSSTQDVYGCTAGHIRKLGRFGGTRITVQNPPKGAA